jgi:microcystin-dependent protein
MADPTSTNILLSLPLLGSNVGTWNIPVNGDFNSMDGYLGGVQSIGVASSNITLTAPAGTPTPSGGPTQAQNAVLRFTGTLTTNVQVTLPLPGYYIVENLTTASGQVLILRAAGSGEVICIDRGDVQHIYSDGTNVRFVNMGRVGHIEMWAGLSAMPAWVLLCTKPPFLLCDGTVYNFSDYPYLGARLGSSFGGNGSTTFAVPDHRGRVALPYDGTGTRITAGIGGLNGQTIGAAADNQGVTLATSQIPSHSHPNSLNDPGHAHVISPTAATQTVGVSGGGGNGLAASGTSVTQNNVTGVSINNASQGGGGSHPNVQPSQVTGIAVIKAS